jgi:hypothetical protein
MIDDEKLSSYHFHNEKPDVHDWTHSLNGHYFNQACFSHGSLFLVFVVSHFFAHIFHRETAFRFFFAPNAIVLALGATSHLLSAVPSIDASKPVNTIPMRP